MPLPPHPAPGVRHAARPAILVAALALAVPLLGEVAPPSRLDPWREALRFEFNSAAEEFARRHAASPEDARLALAHASALLARQPRTQANIQSARAILEKIAATPGDAMPVVAAKLLLGRTAEDHLVPPRPDEARERYAALLREHPRHPLAEQAAVHLALLAAYPAPGEEEATPAARRERVAALRAAVRDPEARRELHTLEARLYLEAGEDAAALPHLVAAREIGFRQPNRNAEIDLSIANIARAGGDLPRARRHYRAFLDQRPRDSRADTVRRQLAELEAAAPTPASTTASAAPRP